MDIGFESAGFEVIWTNEYNKAFAELYGHAFTAWRNSRGHTDESSITSTASIASLRSEAVLKKAFPKGAPKLFGVIGGPPCPDFSRGGKKKGFEGENGKLTRTYVNLLLAIQPAFFVLENVPGLVRYDKPRAVFDKLLKKIEKKGYVVRHRILNALRFGVPQDRERLFAVGLRRDYFKKLFKPGPEDQWQFGWPRAGKYAKALDLNWPDEGKFGGSPVKPGAIPAELTVGGVLKKLPLPEDLPNGKDVFKAKSEKIWRIKEGDISGMSFKRLHRHRYSPTAWYGHNEVHLHPWKPRRLSVREALRIQTVPDAYQFPLEATLSAKFKVVGNGVPCKLAEHLARSVKRVVSGKAGRPIRMKKRG